MPRTYTKMEKLAAEYSSAKQTAGINRQIAESHC